MKDVCGTAGAGWCEQRLSLAGQDAPWISVWHDVVSQCFTVTYSDQSEVCVCGRVAGE